MRKYAISGLEDKTIKLWYVATGKEIQFIKGHKSTVSSVCYSPDGQNVLAGSCDQTIKLWRIKLVGLRVD